MLMHFIKLRLKIILNDVDNQKHFENRTGGNSGVIKNNIALLIVCRKFIDLNLSVKKKP